MRPIPTHTPRNNQPTGFSGLRVAIAMPATPMARNPIGPVKSEIRDRSVVDL